MQFIIRFDGRCIASFSLSLSLSLSLGDRSLIRAPSQFSLATLLRKTLEAARYLARAVQTSCEISPASRG